MLDAISFLIRRRKKKPKPYIKPNVKGVEQAVTSTKPSENDIDSATTEKTAQQAEINPEKAVQQKEIVEAVSEPVNDSVASTQSGSLTDRSPATEEPIQLDLSSQGVSGLSLSSLRVQKEHQSKVEDTSEEKKIREQDVTQESLLQSWETYTEKKVKQGERNMVALLQLDMPRLKNKTEIHLTVPNDTNRVELEKNSAHLLQYLKEQLQNDLLNLQFHVDAKEEKKFVYQAEDKYKELVEKNPIVKEFRKQFFLDF